LHAASTYYWAEIAPDSRLRFLVLVSGAVLFLAGLALIPWLALARTAEGVLAIAWTVLCGREWRALQRGYARNGTLRVAAGGLVERQCRDGSWRPARLCAGSIIATRFAWLRIRPRSGLRYAELVSRKSQKSEDWRRLQVIWRHIGAA
jgi:hypothetical protein